MKFLRHLLGVDDGRKDINELRLRLEEAENKVEKLLKMINMLAKFDESMANDIRTVASHVALMELSMINKKKQAVPSLKRPSNDDDLVN